jgi:hypothetical protein
MAQANKVSLRLLSTARQSFTSPKGGGGDGDVDHALTATFGYFVGLHSLAIRCASAI